MHGDDDTEEFFKRAYDAPLAPPDIPVDHPTAARIYDYLLGGKDNFAADRAAAEQLLAVAPEARVGARANRAFMERAVRYLARDAGVRQFLDLGSGLPAQNNVHQIAQTHRPGARVVYVDNDPIVLAHGRAILAEDRYTDVATADLLRPEDVLAEPAVRDLIDFSEPWALLLVSVLHAIPDADDPAGAIAAYRAHMPPASHLVLSQVALESAPQEALKTLDDLADQARTGFAARPREQIQGFFDGFSMVEPGLVPLSQWHPDADTPGEVGGYLAGAGRVDAQ